MRLNLTRDFYRPSPECQAVLVPTDPSLGLEILTYECAGVPYGVAFIGKGAKSAWHYRFHSTTERDARIQATITARTSSLAYKTTKAEARKAYHHDYKPGDILSCSWGYDQTNVDFYQVISTTDKMVTIRKIYCQATEDDRVLPSPGSFKPNEEPTTHRVSEGGHVKVYSFASAYKWTGGSKYVTPFGFGH
jgi:hypothetical protein